MAYCVLTDMEKLLPSSMLVNLSNDTAGASAVNQTNIDEAIDQADREIDCYLNIAGYTVPISPVPPLVANLSAKWPSGIFIYASILIRQSGVILTNSV